MKRINSIEEKKKNLYYNKTSKIQFSYFSLYIIELFKINIGTDNILNNTIHNKFNFFFSLILILNNNFCTIIFIFFIKYIKFYFFIL